MQPEKTTVTFEKKQSDLVQGRIFFLKLPQIVARDGRYVAYDSSIVCDCYLNTEWYPGTNEDISWNRADRWARDLAVGGGGWSLATIDQLESLYRANKNKDPITPLLKMQPTDVWNCEVDGDSMAWGFNFIPGNTFKTYRSYKSRFRVLAVRRKPLYR